MVLCAASHFWKISNTKVLTSCLQKLSPFAKWQQHLSGVSVHLPAIELRFCEVDSVHLCKLILVFTSGNVTRLFSLLRKLHTTLQYGTTISASKSESVPSAMFAQHRLRSAYSFAQSNQYYHWVNFLKANDTKFPHANKGVMCRLIWDFAGHTSESTFSHVWNANYTTTSL